nr:hypothetical protein CFP56_68152 [Quercus suber]
MSSLKRFWKKPSTNNIEFVEQDPSKHETTKSTKSTPSDRQKRRQQVYEAQKRHRSRNDAYIGGLEQEVSRLQHLSALVTNEKSALAHQNRAMQEILSKQPLHVRLDALGFDTPSAESANPGNALLAIRHDPQVTQGQIYRLDRDEAQCISKASNATTGDSLAALNFILALEWPCKDHVKHAGINPPLNSPTASAEDEFNGHALTTTHAVCHSSLPSHDAAKHLHHDQKGGPKQSGEKWLVELAGRLELSDDQLTPAQAYAITRSRVPSQSLLKPVLEALVVPLAELATCCGFGTVL